MSHSNRGLNEPFYKWIDDVRRAMRKEKELQEKLEFYNMKLIGYKGVSYDRIGSSGSRTSGDSELLFWLDKITAIENRIREVERILSEYKSIMKNLNDIQKTVLGSIVNNQWIEKIKKEIKQSRSRVYQIINEIVISWTNQNYK
ncbi:MAG: hypothetical protein KKH01_03690 [Firmicutes bacterium]|nr:hypothetical protein [Bacillota bacterium]